MNTDCEFCPSCCVHGVTTYLYLYLYSEETPLLLDAKPAAAVVYSELINTRKHEGLRSHEPIKLWRSIESLGENLTLVLLPAYSIRLPRSCFMLYWISTICFCSTYLHTDSSSFSGMWYSTWCTSCRLAWSYYYTTAFNFRFGANMRAFRRVKVEGITAVRHTVLQLGVSCPVTWSGSNLKTWKSQNGGDFFFVKFGLLDLQSSINFV